MDRTTLLAAAAIALSPACVSQDMAAAGDSCSDGKCDGTGVTGGGNGSLVEKIIDSDTSPLKTVWWPTTQQHDLGRAGSWDRERGWSWTTTSKDHAGTMVRSAPRPLYAGSFVFSLQLFHQTDPGEDLGTLNVLADGQLVASRAIKTRSIATTDWQREAISFTIDRTSNVSFELYWGGTIELWTGNLLLTKPGRPFYNIAHNPNSLDLVYAALDAGANAIEPDVQRENGTIDIREVGGTLTDPITHANVRSDLVPYLGGIASRSEIAAIIWDVKPTTETTNADFGSQFTSALQDAGLPPSRSVLSLQSASMSDFWPPESAGYGRDVSSVVGYPGFNTDPTQWYTTARANALTFMGMGITSLVPVQHSVWFGPLTVCVNGRDRYGDLGKVEYWTVGSRVQLRKLLDLGVDGVIADDNAMVASVLQEEPYAELYRLATPDDDPAAVHGFPYGPSD